MKTISLITAFIFIYVLPVLSQIPTESSIKYDPGSKKLESFDVVDLNNELKSIELKKGKFFLLDSSIPACKGCLKGIS